eukprot:Phypoly_transcript_00376.p1 GENE.Phypoly_transcript_00376~~Phypoly_transcript_00376.p1  ORF type:complete len:1480 (+),score=208.99 Phypoly_transcript_00376:579-5018(+)
MVCFVHIKQDYILPFFWKINSYVFKFISLFRDGDEDELYEEIDDDPYERMEREDTHISSVLAKIQERDTSNFTYQFPTFKSSPFPEVAHRSLKPPKSTLQPPVTTLQKIEKPKDRAQEIHEENTQKIALLSAGEIVEAQQDILKSLDQNLVNKLRNRGSRSVAQSSVRTSSAQPPSSQPLLHSEDDTQKIASVSASQIAEAPQDILMSLDPSLANMMHNRKANSRSAAQTATQPYTNPPTSNPPTQPMPSSQSLSQQIHKENTQKISLMSVSEITRAQQDILKSLDPSLVNMLRNRKSGSHNTTPQPQPQPIPSTQLTQSTLVQTTQSIPTQPIPTQSMPMQPIPAQSMPTQPIPQQSCPAQPVPQPIPSAQPTQSTPVHVEQYVPTQPTTQPTPISIHPTSSATPAILPSAIALALKRGTPKELEEQRRIRQEKRKKQQEDQMQEMREEFEKANKSAIELAEGAKEEEPALPLAPSRDIAHWRFDFDGNFVERGSQVPAHLGLHHHGDEQSEAGYTLSELHFLARSTFSGQKILALKTLANILSNPNKEKYNTELRAHILELKFPRLFRAALDDMNPAVISATVDALHALVVDTAWEKQAILLSHRYRGHEGLPLHPITTHQGKIGPKPKDDDEPEPDDDERMRADLVKGLLRTNLLNRLRYLLEIVKIPTTAVPIIEILMHVARHSTDAAKELFECPRMVECIITEFIKVAYDLSSFTGVTPYTTPLVQALRLLSVLCQSSRKIAENIAKSGLMLDITKFVEAVQSNRLAVAIELFCESLFMWKVISSYGIPVDCMRRVGFLFELVQNWSPAAVPDPAACSIVTELYNMLEVTTHAPSPKSEDPASESLSFDQIAFFVNPAIGLLANLDLRDATQTHFTNAAASMVHFLASYVQKLCKLFASGSGNLYSIIEHFCATVLLSILPQFDLEIISSMEGDTKAVFWEFSLGFFRLMRICTHAHSTIGALLRECYLPFCKGGVVGLLWRLLLFCSNEKVPRTSRSLFQHRSLFHVQYVLLQLLDLPCLVCEEFLPVHNQNRGWDVVIPSQRILSELNTSSSPETVWFQSKHDIAMHLVLNFLPGELVLLLDCLRKFVFHPMYLEHVLPDGQNKMAIAEGCIEFFDNELFPTRDINNSSHLIIPTQENINSLYLPFREQINQYSLPLDPSYALFPIQFHYDHMYNTSLEYNSALPPPTLDQLTHYLQFWRLLEQSGSPYLDVFIDPALRYITLMKVFLLSEDLFLEPPIQHAIMSIFSSLTNGDTKMDLSLLSGPKFTGFLSDFISQFSAVSYGDAGFASVLFVFLRMEFPDQFRKMIWRDLFEMLPLLQNSTPFPLGKEGYLFPIESNDDLLRLYVDALVNEKVTNRRCSTLYWISIHHLSGHIFSTAQDFTWTKQDFLRKLIMDTQNQDILFDLLAYQCEEKEQDKNQKEEKEDVNKKEGKVEDGLAKISLSEIQKEVLQCTQSTFSEISARLLEYGISL